MTQKLIMCRGLPASGKSTWRKAEVKSNPNIRHWNNDEARANWPSWTKDREKALSDKRIAVILCYLTQGFTVIVDDTNLNPIHEETYRKIAEEFGIEFEIKEFAVDVVTCIRNDANRENPVGKKTIMDMSRKWKYNPQPPPEFEVVRQDNSLVWAIIVDIDGTIAKMGDRSPFDYTKVHLDKPHWDVIELIDMVKSVGKYKVIVCSWRKDDCKEETIKWLDDAGFYYDELHMRKSWDNRKDSHIKYEILVNKITPKYYVEYVFDDRNQVVKMYRECWLRVLQVADGDF